MCKEKKREKGFAKDGFYMKVGKHGPFPYGVSCAKQPFNKHLLSQNENLKE